MPKSKLPPPDERLRNFVRDVLPRIRDRYQPTEVWLWGSHAYGEPHEYSDIDVVVVSDRFDGGGPAERAIALMNELDLWFNDEVGSLDIICYTPAEFDRQRNRITIVAEGIKKGRRLL